MFDMGPYYSPPSSISRSRCSVGVRQRFSRFTEAHDQAASRSPGQKKIRVDQWRTPLFHHGRVSRIGAPATLNHELRSPRGPSPPQITLYGTDGAMQGPPRIRFVGGEQSYRHSRSPGHPHARTHSFETGGAGFPGVAGPGRIRSCGRPASFRSRGNKPNTVLEIIWKPGRLHSTGRRESRDLNCGTTAAGCRRPPPESYRRLDPCHKRVLLSTGGWPGASNRLVRAPPSLQDHLSARGFR